MNDSNPSSPITRPRRLAWNKGKLTGQRSKMVFLFDHLVGASEQRWWYGEPKRLGGLQIDHQLVLGRLLHGKVRGLVALEDAIDVAGRAPIRVAPIQPVGDQAAAGDVEASAINCRQSIPGCQGDDQIAMAGRQRARHDDKAAV